MRTISALPTIAGVAKQPSASSFFAHTHNYPGRMSVHLVPFAVAMTACAAARLFPAETRRRVEAGGRAEVSL